MSVLLQTLLLMAGLLLSGLSHAAVPVDACNFEHLKLMPAALVLEDQQATLSLEDILQLPEARFDAATADWPTQGHTRSAFWLRLQLENSGGTACSRLLTVGAPRLADIQVYQRSGERWRVARAGSAYPVEIWPEQSRRPTFPVELPAQETAVLLVRVASSSQMLLDPELWTERELLQSQHRTYLTDGLTLGIVSLIVPFGLIVGWIMHSRLLMVHAGAVLGYILLTCILNGYLVYWPAAVAWTRELMTLASVASFVFFLAYVRVLLQVSRLPRIFAWLYLLVLIGFAGGRLWELVVVDSGQVARIFLLFALYLLLPATLFAGWRKGLSYNWLAWLVPGLYMLQFAVRHLLELDQVPWQSQQDRYSLSSTLPGVALLVCTLIMEVSRSRTREKRALANLEQQRKAEQERLESTVALRTAQLRESLAARSTLMARISHDLRSPLVSIIDYARLLGTVSNSGYPRKIERNAHHQLELIDELLEYSRGELEQMELTLAPGYLYGFLHEIEEEAGFLASRQGNRFETLFADDLPSLVQADFKRLRQILMNLLANAAKFTRDGDIRFEVGCSAGATPEQVELQFSVSDTGIGIDSAEREQLLQPFRRGSNARHLDGSGLGLSIVTQLLQHMDSRLELDATEQGGSRFSFRLQLRQAQEQELDSALADDYAVSFDGQGLRVLVVDDIEQNREWLYDLLAGYGCDVTTAASGEEALAYLATPPELLISDQMMPDMDGWELLREVRKRCPALPALLYSAAPARRPQGYPEELTFDAVLLKPTGSRELLGCIDRLTADQAMKRQMPSKGRSAC
ncbi:hybrid sensor histidine kinase/response regulator [Stutzerimonas nitrititolerans]|uniref:hybrid sensor histidine kinase/response regulator n=1 Tax=Stutzerimonas nitrititolerans TaxID=2482751 RepID=UPI0028AA0D13|nr:7TM-DISM domain-containing protein [Stutzerimonas nitrititolerans]